MTTPWANKPWLDSMAASLDPETVESVSPSGRAALALSVRELIEDIQEHKVWCEDLVPARYRLQYDEGFWSDLTICLISVGSKLATARAERHIPNSMGEDIALYMIIRHAETEWGAGVEMVGEEGGTVPSPYDVEPDFADFEDEVFWDLDHEMLYDDAFDGVDHVAGFGASSQRFEDWFTRPYGDMRIHPALADHELAYKLGDEG